MRVLHSWNIYIECWISSSWMCFSSHFVCILITFIKKSFYLFLYDFLSNYWPKWFDWRVFLFTLRLFDCFLHLKTINQYVWSHFVVFQQQHLWIFFFLSLFDNNSVWQSAPRVASRCYCASQQEERCERSNLQKTQGNVWTKN